MTNQELFQAALGLSEPWFVKTSLTARQKAKLAQIAEINMPLYRAYLLKEQLRHVFALRGASGMAMLREWLGWAVRSRLKPFVRLAADLRRHLPAIEAALTHGLTNAPVESVTRRSACSSGSPSATGTPRR